MKNKNSHQLNVMFHVEALDLLNKLAPTSKSKGDFLMRLLFEHERCLYDRMKFREQRLLEEEKLSTMISKEK